MSAVPSNPSPLHAEARRLAEAGIKVFPCLPDAKAPATPNGFHDASKRVEQIDQWWTENPNYNIGLCPEDAGWCVIDIDPGGEAPWIELFTKEDGYPETYEVQTPRGGLHLYFVGSLPSSASKLAHHVDTRGIGGYVLVPPSVVGGKRYTVLHDREKADLPEWIGKRLAQANKRIDAGDKPLDTDIAVGRATSRVRSLVAKGDVAIQGRGGDHRTVALFAELKDLGVSADKALEIVVAEGWNAACQPPWDIEELKVKRDNGFKYAQNSAGAATDTRPAEEAFASHIEKAKAKEQEKAPEQKGDNAPDGSEIELARIFARLFKDRYCYVATGKNDKGWYIFDGMSWRKDDTLRVRKDIQGCIVRYAMEAQDPRVAARLAASRIVLAVELQVQPLLAIAPDKWDTDPNVLCTPGGIVDLRTGNIRPARPEDYCRKITAVAPAAPETPCPRNFKRVLDNITGGDPAVEAYMQRVAGYCLTGEQTEKAFFIVVGETNSGKSTLFETVREIMGDYAWVAAPEVFLADPKGMARSTNDLAELNGYRLVVASEPERSRSLSVSRIKTMVGIDSTSNRKLYQQSEVHKTTWKGIIHCNHVPHLGFDGDDAAIKDRLRIIDGGRTIPREKRDKRLPEKLKAEYPAILRWMIDGAAILHIEGGLHEPPAVVARSKRYFAAVDPFTDWLEQCTREDASAWHSTDQLYASYQGHTGDVSPLSPKHVSRTKFGTRLSEAHVLTPKRQAGTGARGWMGRALLAEPAAAPPYQTVADPQPGEFAP